MKQNQLAITKKAKALLEFPHYDKKRRLKYGVPTVICGFSPYARRLCDVLLEEKRTDLVILDFPPPTQPCQYRGIDVATINNTLPSIGQYVICSNPNLGFYAEKLALLSIPSENIFSWHELSLSDSKFDFNLIRYNNSLILDRRAHFLLEKAYYIDMLDSLADNESRELLAKVILFFFTLDVSCLPVQKISPAYFGADFIEKSRYAKFADCGAFTGDTLKDFLSFNPEFQEYYLFEADSDNFIEAKKVTGDPRIFFFNIAVSDKKGVVKFNKAGTTVGAISDSGDTEVLTDKLDDILPKDIGCIKMDIEGGEYNALVGAEKIIRIAKPLLMISVEHKPDDIKKLSELIKSYNKDYKIFLRACADSIYTDLTMFCV